MNRRHVLTIAFLASLTALGACQSSGKKDTGTANANMGIVNTKCPMRPDCPIKTAVTTEHNGQKVGFCCAGCIGHWNKASDEQKATLLKAAM